MAAGAVCRLIASASTDDDELEQDRKMRQDKKTQGDASKKQDKRRRGLFGGLFG